MLLGCMIQLSHAVGPLQVWRFFQRHCNEADAIKLTIAAAFPQGREIIANLSKAAGLATMIAAMRPDIDNIDEYVRNTTARAFSVVASALGIPALLPFLKAVCQSKKSWQVGLALHGASKATAPASVQG
jgi:hypothetical protein